MTVKLQTEWHLEFLSSKGGCTGLSESTLVKMPQCWKSHVAAQILIPHDLDLWLVFENTVQYCYSVVVFVFNVPPTTKVI